jgi:hypothetical protein
MAISKTLTIVLSLFIALVIFSKHLDQCCDTFTDTTVSIVDLQIEDDNQMDADEPILLSDFTVPFHPLLSMPTYSTLTRYNPPDLPIIFKPPRV